MNSRDFPGMSRIKVLKEVSKMADKLMKFKMLLVSKNATMVKKPYQRFFVSSESYQFGIRQLEGTGILIFFKLICIKSPYKTIYRGLEESMKIVLSVSHCGPT